MEPLLPCLLSLSLALTPPSSCYFSLESSSLSVPLTAFVIPHRVSSFYLFTAHLFPFISIARSLTLYLSPGSPHWLSVPLSLPSSVYRSSLSLSPSLCLSLSLSPSLSLTRGLALLCCLSVGRTQPSDPDPSHGGGRGVFEGLVVMTTHSGPRTMEL